MSPETLAALARPEPLSEEFREAILTDWGYCEALALAARRRTARAAA